MSVFNWKDGEYQYCADVVRVGGTLEVPRDSIVAYLDCQLVDARKDKRADVVEALEMLRGHAREVWAP